MQLAGIHHLTAISAKPRENLAFYTGLLGMRLVKKEMSRTALVLTEVMNMRRARDYAAHGAQIHVFAMGEASDARNPAAELHVIEDQNSPVAQRGAGGVHHVAFRTPDETQYHAWTQRLNELRVPNSGEVDRFYFRSLYFREPSGILFEIATDGPGFATDEPMGHARRETGAAAVPGTAAHAVRYVRKAARCRSGENLAAAPALLRIGNGRSGMWAVASPSAQDFGNCLLMSHSLHTACVAQGRLPDAE